MLKWLKNIKDYLDLIVKIVAVVGILTSTVGIRSCAKIKKQKDNIQKILTSEVKQFKTESKRNATTAVNWQLKHDALKRHYKENNDENLAKINRYNKELSEAKQTIKELKIKENNTQNYIKNELISKDSIRTELVFFDCDNIEIKPIRKKHIQIDFIQSGSFLDVKYQYIANVKTIISRYPELKNNGKKHFPNWGFLWGWDYKTTSIINDPNASISNLVSIEFDK